MWKHYTERKYHPSDIWGFQCEYQLVVVGQRGPYIDDLDRLDEKQTSFEKLDKRINDLEKQVQELANKIDDACDLIKKRSTKKMDM